jgi:hypothetical protein
MSNVLFSLYFSFRDLYSLVEGREIYHEISCIEITK